MFYTFDPMGNVAQRYTSTGTLVSSDFYDSFGSATSTATPADPFGYEGKFGYYSEHGTSLILCGHRFYDSSAGRFINRDPIGYAGGNNLYGYAGNNPVNVADPSGFDPNGSGLPGEFEPAPSATGGDPTPADAANQGTEPIGDIVPYAVPPSAAPQTVPEAAPGGGDEGVGCGGSEAGGGSGGGSAGGGDGSTGGSFGQGGDSGNPGEPSYLNPSMPPSEPLPLPAPDDGFVPNPSVEYTNNSGQVANYNKAKWYSSSGLIGTLGQRPYNLDRNTASDVVHGAKSWGTLGPADNIGLDKAGGMWTLTGQFLGFVWDHK